MEAILPSVWNCFLKPLFGEGMAEHGVVSVGGSSRSSQLRFMISAWDRGCFAWASAPGHLAAWTGFCQRLLAPEGTTSEFCFLCLSSWFSWQHKVLPSRVYTCPLSAGAMCHSWLLNNWNVTSVTINQLWLQLFLMCVVAKSCWKPFFLWFSKTWFLCVALTVLVFSL